MERRPASDTVAGKTKSVPCPHITCAEHAVRAVRLVKAILVRISRMCDPFRHPISQSERVPDIFHQQQILFLRKDDLSAKGPFFRRILPEGNMHRCSAEAERSLKCS